MESRKIAIYGHKGVGTTTLVTNLAAALAEAGSRVIVVCCDGELNSTAVLHPRRNVSPLIETISRGDAPGNGYVVSGFKGIRSIEFGRIRNNEEFAGGIARLRGILETEQHDADFILYDLAGDPQQSVIPLAEQGFIDELLLVTSAQVAALKAMNHLLRLHSLGVVPETLRITGIIGNGLQSPYAESVVDDFSRKVGLPVIAYIPRSLVVCRCEFFGETLVDAAPLAYHTYLYRKLGKIIAAGLPALAPVSFSPEDFHDWGLDWGDRLYDLGEGVVEIGSAI